MNNLFLFSWPCFLCRCVHGTCLPINAFSYSCKCLQGHGGVLCDEEEMLFNPCQSIRCKHGKCRLSGLGKPYCECSSGYTGDSCDKGKPFNIFWYFMLEKVLFKHERSNHCQSFFSPTIHSWGVFCKYTIKGLSQWEKKPNLFAHEFKYLYLDFFHQVFCCENISLFFFPFIQKHIFPIYNYYLLPAVSFCIYCFSAFCNWEAKSNDSAPSFITNSTFDLSASTDLSQRIMQVRWIKTGWLFPLPFSFFLCLSELSPSLSLLYPSWHLFCIVHQCD